MKINKYLPNIDHLTWYDKVLIGLTAVLILISLYVYACTCSIQTIAILKQLEPFFLVIKSLDYVCVLMIIISLFFQTQRVIQIQQLFGLVILGTAIIVASLQFLPNMVNNTNHSRIYYSLLHPQYSIISWLNLLWFSTMGLMNFFTPIFNSHFISINKFTNRN